MATDDQINIIMNVLGAEKIAQAKAAIEAEEEAIRQLGAALAAGKVSHAQFDSATTASAQKIQAANAQIKASSGAINGRALLEFSRAAEDAQYGVMGIQNNIPGLVAAMGGGAGLAGAASIASIALGLLYKNWDSLMGAFGGSKTQTEAAAMQELADKIGKTAEEYEKLARYQALKGKTEEIRSSKTEAQTKQDDAVTKAIIETGPADVAKGFLKADKTAFDAALPGITDPNKKDGTVLKNYRGEDRTALVDLNDAQRALHDYESGASRKRPSGGMEEVDPTVLRGFQQRRDEAQKALDQARDQAALDNTSAAAISKFFPGKLQQLQDAVEKDPNAFGEKGNELRKKLKESQKTPDDIEDEKAEAHALAQHQEGENRFNEWVEKGRQSEEELDKQAEAHALQQEMEYQQKLANWQAQGQQKIDDEDAAAISGDAMNKWRKQREEGQKTSQVFSGGVEFHNMLQQAVKGPDKDPTLVEQLEVQREIAENTKRFIEMRTAQQAAIAG